jgi:hypothetical protein
MHFILGADADAAGCNGAAATAPSGAGNYTGAAD